MGSSAHPAPGGTRQWWIEDRALLDLGRDELHDTRGRPIVLRPQAFRVLRLLALNAGRVVGKDEVMAAVWPGLVVTDDSLVQAIGDVRRALGDEAHRIVKTVPRQGYLLVAEALHEVPPPPPAPAARPAAARRRLWAVAVAAVGSLGVAGWWLFAPAGGPAPPVGRLSIAVLPFGGDGSPGIDQLARNFSGDLTAALARNGGLRVAATAWSSSVTGRGLQPQEIGRQLHVQFVVDGRLRRDGDLVLATLELVAGQDGQVVWSLRQVVDTQASADASDDRLDRVAGRLQARAIASEEHRLLAHPPRHPDADERSLRALALARTQRADDLREARQMLLQTLQTDARHAPVWAALATVNAIDTLLGLTGEWHPGRHGDMLAQAQRAIELDPRLPAGYAAMSALHLSCQRDALARQAAERCVELAPSDAECHHRLASAHLRTVDGAPRVQAVQRMLDLHPDPPARYLGTYGLSLWLDGRAAEALRVTGLCLQQVPREARCRMAQTLSLAELGQLDDARSEARRLRDEVPSASVAWLRDQFADVATAARERVERAGRAAGLPERAASSAAATPPRS